MNEMDETMGPAPAQPSRSNGANKTQFQPGHARTRGLNRKGQGAGRPKPPKVLLDMRAVYNQPADRDRTAGQKALRKLLQANPEQFFSQLTQLERALLARDAKAKAARPAEGPPEPDARDEGTERCLGLLDEYLERLWQEEERAEYERLRAKYEGREAAQQGQGPAAEGGADVAAGQPRPDDRAGGGGGPARPTPA
jgi:hypothetical protein